MPKSTNDILFDRAVRHAVFLERYKNNEVDEIVGFLNREVFPDVTRQIQERTGGVIKATGKVRTRRLKSLEKAVKGEISTGMRLASSQLRKDMTGLAITEAEFQGAAVEAAMSPITVDFDIPNVATLREIAVDSPVQGRTIRQWFSKMSNDSYGNIMGEVNIGLAEGQSVPEIVRRIRGTAAAAFGDGTYNQIRNWTKSIVRTTSTHVSTRAREATYEANEELIKAVQYVATLDARTTEICASLDGRQFPINEGERPPMHHQCRSTTIPVIKSFKELGITAKEIPPGTKIARVEGKINGQVPVRQTYPEWLRKQPKRTQDKMLGPTRAKLWRDGKVEMSGFVNESGKKLNLETLRLEEGLPIKDIRRPTK